MEGDITAADGSLKLSEPLTGTSKEASDLEKNMPVLTFTKDIKTGKYLSCCQSFADFVRRSSPDEVTGLTAEDLFGTDRAALIFESDKETLRSERPYAFYEKIADARGILHSFQITKMKTLDSSGRECIIGIGIDISEPVRIMEDRQLRDELTGVKNKQAFELHMAALNRHIRNDDHIEFAISTFDVNDLKAINVSAGTHAGDETLRMVCTMICDIFVHSPVFRIGGDEFAVISRGQDYELSSGLMAEIALYNQQSRKNGGLVIAGGMACYSGESSVEEVLEKALQRMYKNKEQLKLYRK